jgi:MFS superfamily sulfate permease-like transporter
VSKYINQKDLLASIVVFLVALPLCMGIAIASGVPPARGLVTGIIGGVVTGLLAGSPLQVSGPAAGLAVLVYELVTTHGVGWLGLVVLGAGALQWLAGRCGMGRAFQAVSPAVVKGMLAGIGVLIVGSQFHVMVDDKPQGGGLQNLLAIPQSLHKALFPMDGSLHHLAALTGLVTLALVLLWEKFRPARLELVPGPLVAITGASLLSGLAGWQISRIEVPTSLDSFVAWPEPQLLGQFSPALLVAIVAMAFIASAETLLSANAVDGMHDGPRTDYDQELKAQGVGNMLCGVLGGLPMTGVIVRSSTNIKAGAQTRASAVWHGVWLAATVLLAPGLLALIPTSALAAILVFIGYKLVDVQAIKALWAVSRWEVAIYAVTVVTIVATDLLTGVLAGLAAALARLLYSLAHLELRVDSSPNGSTSVHLDGAATFVSLPQLSAALETVRPGQQVTLHLDGLLYLDLACRQALEDFSRLYERQGGTVVMEGRALDRLSAADRLRLLGSEPQPKAMAS